LKSRQSHTTLTTTAELFQEATVHHRAGRWQEAEACYRRVLAIAPRFAECHYGLGTLAAQFRRIDIALLHLRRAAEIAPEETSYHVALARLLGGAGQLREAASSYRAALRLCPREARLHAQLGDILSALEQFEKAAAHYREAVRLQPRLAEAHTNLGNALHLLGRHEEAAAACREAVRLNPASAPAHNNLGNALRGLNRFEEAESCYREALRLRPELAQVHRNLGDTLALLGRGEEAIPCYRESVRLKPDDAGLHKSLGDLLMNLNGVVEAETCYREAVRLAPDFAEAWNHLGLAVASLGRPQEAERCYGEALRVRPDFVVARLNRAMARLPIVYRSQAEVDEVRRDYARELDAACRIEAAVRVPDTAEITGSYSPFFLAYQGRCDRELQAIYGSFVARVMASLYPDWASPPDVAPPQPGEPIRVGILSECFYSHSNWKIPIKGWLRGLDRSRFQLFGYYIGCYQDKATALAKSLCHRFVQGLPTLERWAQAIRSDRLHVLLIPAIGMDDVTIRLAALRLAPVQATSWGHPDTSGLPTIDHYLSSELMEPPGADAHYTERLVRLPNLSIWYEPPVLVPEAVSRAELGVPEAAVLYWCCQSLFKYLPRHDWVFARIAAAVPEARFLFIRYPHGDTVTTIFRDRLIAAFAEAGLDAERYCRFLAPMSMTRFAGVSRIADVFLDSLEWSGCNSTLEALAWDLPVVTMAGDLMRGRHSAAILTMLGMPDLIADCPERFVELATELGRDGTRRRALATRIARDKHKLYADRACIEGLARYLQDAAHAI
jgi:predicted O-linked N-acetylglucosamine transferase (SPINDLY family)